MDLAKDIVMKLLWVADKFHNNEICRNIDYFFNVHSRNDISSMNQFIEVAQGQAHLIDTRVKSLNDIETIECNFKLSNDKVSQLDYFDLNVDKVLNTHGSQNCKSKNMSELDYFEVINPISVYHKCYVDDVYCISNNVVDMDYFSDVQVSPGDLSDQVDIDYAVDTQHMGVVPHSKLQVFEGPSGGVIASVNELLSLGSILRSSCASNFQQKLKSLNTYINICKLHELAIDNNYYDKQIVDLLEFGFPLDMQMQYFTPTNDIKNHPSATTFIEHVYDYINEKIKLGAILGPFSKIPNESVHVSPLMTRPRGNDKRRVIVDLSFLYEFGKSVNSVTSPHTYLNTAYTLRLLTVDSICDIVNQTQSPVKLFKIDLARAFRQLNVDPGDIYNLGLKIENSYFLDTALPFGWRTGTAACQRLTDLIWYILDIRGAKCVNYIDDLIGISSAETAHKHFQIVVDLLKELNLQVSTEKTVEPSSKVTCLGIVIDCETGSLLIPEAKLLEIIQICNQYLNKIYITRTQLQSLVGSLIFLHKAVKPARMFINRILALLRQIKGSKQRISIDAGMRHDLKWFISCAEQFNGTVNKMFYPQEEIYINASFIGLGARWGNRVELHNVNRLNIAYLEAVNIIVALKVWGPHLRNRKVKVWCDNAAAVTIIGLGRGQHSDIQAVARNVWLWASIYNIEVEFQHIQGTENVIADLLSRCVYHSNPDSASYKLINDQPVWFFPSDADLILNFDI
jgi:hypothetical protein